MSVPLQPRARRADAQRNRDRILCAARAEVARAGGEAQMDAIAAAAGVGVGTVYRHFPTKDALLEELVRSHFEHLVEVAQAALADPGRDPWAAWEGFVRDSAQACHDDAGLQRAFYAASPTSVGSRLAAQTGLFEHTDALIARGKQAGAIRPDFTPTDVGMFFCGLSAVMAASGPGWDWRRHLELLLDGVRAR